MTPLVPYSAVLLFHVPHTALSAGHKIYAICLLSHDKEMNRNEKYALVHCCNHMRECIFSITNYWLAKLLKKHQITRHGALIACLFTERHLTCDFNCHCMAFHILVTCVKMSALAPTVCCCTAAVLLHWTSFVRKMSGTLSDWSVTSGFCVIRTWTWCASCVSQAKKK